MPLLFLYWVAGDCFCRDNWMMSEAPAPDGFNELPGVIGTTLIHWPGGGEHINHFQFHGGRIVRVTSLPAPDKYATSVGGPIRANWAPTRFGDLYIPSEGPYQKSPDGRFFAAGTHVQIPGVGSATWYRRANLIIVDLASGDIVARIDSGDEWSVHAIAWAPDGRYIAFMRYQTRWGSCLFEKLSHMIGHPVPIDSLYLDVIDLQGKVVASADLAKELHYLSGRLIWAEDTNIGKEPKAQTAPQLRDRAQRAFQ